MFNMSNTNSTDSQGMRFDDQDMMDIKPDMIDVGTQTDRSTRAAMPNISNTDSTDRQGMRSGDQDTMDIKPDMASAGTQLSELSSNKIKDLEPIIAEESKRVHSRGLMTSEYLTALQKQYIKEKERLALLHPKDEAQAQTDTSKGETQEKTKRKDQSTQTIHANKNGPDAQSAVQGASSPLMFALAQLGIRAREYEGLIDNLNQLIDNGKADIVDKIYTIALRAAKSALEEAILANRGSNLASPSSVGNNETNSGALAQFARTTMENIKEIQTAREAELERRVKVTEEQRDIMAKDCDRRIKATQNGKEEYKRRLTALEADKMTLEMEKEALKVERDTLKESLAAVLSPVDHSAFVRAAPLSPPIAGRSASYQTIMSPRYTATHPATASTSWRDRSSGLPTQSPAYTSQGHSPQSSTFIKQEPSPTQASNCWPPGTDQKVYCTYWIRRGECDYAAVGCKYKHEMPDMPTLNSLGFRELPKWYLERLEEEYPSGGCAL